MACHSPRRRFEPYFDRKKKLMPKPSDLSFYNWETQTGQEDIACSLPKKAAAPSRAVAPGEASHSCNPSCPLQVIADNEAGLLFKNKRDRKVINVDPKARPGDNSRRIELHTHEYIQCQRPGFPYASRAADRCVDLAPGAPTEAQMRPHDERRTGGERRRRESGEVRVRRATLETRRCRAPSTY
eukprot:scaffold19162_cov118-Isochrysis_galbana.AAC.3